MADTPSPSPEPMTPRARGTRKVEKRKRVEETEQLHGETVEPNAPNSPSIRTEKRRRAEPANESSSEQTEGVVAEPPKTKSRKKAAKEASTSTVALPPPPTNEPESSKARKKAKKHHKKTKVPVQANVPAPAEGEGANTAAGEGEAAAANDPNDIESEGEFVIPQSSRGVGAKKGWVPPEGIVKAAGVYENHMEPFQLLPEPKSESIQQLRNSVKFPVLVSVWGRVRTQYKTSLIKSAFKKLIERDVKVIEIGEGSTWVMVGCFNREIRDRVLQQGAMLNEAGYLIFFRKVENVPFKTRYFVADNRGKISVEKYTKKLVAKYPGSQVVEKSVPTKHPNSVICQITLPDEHRSGFTLSSWPVRGRDAGASWEVKLTKAPHCTGCHSEDHYSEDCPWKKLNVGVKLKDTHW
jgi:hypothetical protein